jgi:two-component system cell cycle sensor histidine kinase/response regulator CckA
MLRTAVRSQPEADDLDYLRNLTELLGSTLSRLRAARTLTERMRQADRMALLGRAVVDLVHDFNNTLYTIQCVTDVLLLDAPESSRTRRDLEEIKKAAHRGSALTRRLIVFGGAQSRGIEPLNLRDVVTEFAPTLERILGPQVRLQLDLEADPTWTLGDRSLIEQLLLHSVLEAQPHATGETPLRIGLSLAPRPLDTTSTLPAESHPSFVELTVGPHDGTGPKLFPPSRDLDTMLDALAQRGAVPEHTESFIRVRLPRLQAPTPTASPCVTPASQKKPTTAERTLLFVDDEEMLRHTAACGLTQAGYRVIEAASCRQASELLSSTTEPIAAMVTDLTLVDGNGVTLCRQFLATHPTGKVVFVSGCGREVLRDSGLGDEEHAFLQKPFRGSELVALLGTLLER